VAQLQARINGFFHTIAFNAGTQSMNERILLVDDEEDLLEILSEFLGEKHYAVSCAHNGYEALETLKNAAFDLVLSDINMPGMKGFELINEVTRLYPSIKTALITAYDVRDYLQMARTYNIGNIIAKTAPFNFDEVELLIHNILSEEVFGLERYVQGSVLSYSIKTSSEIEGVIDRIVEFMPEQRQKRKFRQALGEIIINAVYYGAKNERGDRKSDWDFDVTLAPDEEVLVTWGKDDEKAGVAVRDQKGRLTKQQVLFWLGRNSTKGNDGLSIGLFDEHGKGLYITRETIDRFIVNVKRQATTEVVMLMYREGLYDGFRPLWIHEF
jgi:CheY-like chemotaxis protein